MSPSRLYPTSGGAGDTPSFRHDENVSVADPRIFQAIRAEDISTLDVAVWNPIYPDDVTVDDLNLWPLVAPILVEDVAANDPVHFAIFDMYADRSATPDNDKMFDAYVDQTLPTTNFGNANLQVKKKSPALDDEKKAVFTVDLSETDDFNTCAVFALYFRASTSRVAGGAQNLQIDLYHAPAKPFTESTVTWNNGATVGTLVKSETQGIATGAIQTYSFIVDSNSTNLSGLIGSWATLVFTITEVTDTGVDTITIRSRDSATDRPHVQVDLLRGT